MALNTGVKIFKKGRRVWVVKRVTDGFFVKRAGRVVSVSKGRIHVELDSGEIVDYSPNSRLLNLTVEEADAICTILK